MVQACQVQSSTLAAGPILALGKRHMIVHQRLLALVTAEGRPLPNGGVAGLISEVRAGPAA